MKTEPVKHLKKVTLLLLAGSGPEKFDLIDSPVPFQFVYGVASDGLCPFESALSDKHEGDKLAISVSFSNLRLYFGYLYHNLPALGAKIMPETLYMEIEVASVTDADDREVVQAIGKSLAHGGCGGSCGCGC
jgi:hypothetical protein